MSTCNKQFLLKNVTASFVKIAEPVMKMSGQGKEYSIQVIMPKDHPQVDDLQKAIVEIAKTAFPGVTLPRDCVLMRDSDAEGKGEAFDYMKDTWFFNLRRNERQGPVPCVDAKRIPFVPTEQNLFSGCLINVHIGLFDYSVFQPGTNKIMKRGVSGSLNGIQLIDNVNVTRLGGGAPAPMFEEEEGGNVNLSGETAPEVTAESENAPAPQEASIPW